MAKKSTSKQQVNARNCLKMQPLLEAGGHASGRPVCWQPVQPAAAAPNGPPGSGARLPTAALLFFNRYPSSSARGTCSRQLLLCVP